MANQEPRDITFYYDIICRYPVKHVTNLRRDLSIRETGGQVKSSRLQPPETGMDARAFAGTVSEITSLMSFVVASLALNMVEMEWRVVSVLVDKLFIYLYDDCTLFPEYARRQTFPGYGCFC